MNANKLAPFVRYIHYIEPQYMYSLRTRLGYDHRIFFCESGRIQIRAADEVYTLVKNSLLYVPSGEIYVLGTHEDNAKLIGINFDFGYEFSNLSVPISPAVSKDGYDVGRQLEKPDFSDVECFRSVFVIHGQSELGSLIYRIFDEYTTARIYHAQNASAIMKQLLITSARILTLGADKAPQKTANIVISYIQEHYMENISNTDVFSFVKQNACIKSNAVILYRNAVVCVGFMRHNADCSTFLQFHKTVLNGIFYDWLNSKRRDMKIV